MQEIVKYYQSHDGYYPGNELVMHDGIPTELMVDIWVTNGATKRNLINTLSATGVTCPVSIRVKRNFPSKQLLANEHQLKKIRLNNTSSNDVLLR